MLFFKVEAGPDSATIIEQETIWYTHARTQEGEKPENVGENWGE